MGLTAKAGAQEVLVARQGLAVQGEPRREAALEELEDRPEAPELVEGPPALQLAARAAVAPREPLDLRAELAVLELEGPREARAAQALARAAEARPGVQLGAREAAVGRRPASGVRRRVLPSA